MARSKRIAIIGAGPAGLTAIKCCKEEGFIPVCYELTGALGGLWRYRDEDTDGVSSLMRTTIIKSSKEMTAYSDFPPPKEFPNFMHNKKVLDYLMLYAEAFDLLRHIRYHLEVINIEPSKNYEYNGCWTVTLKSTQTKEISREEFDGVMVCTGHFSYPNVPDFPGQQRFKGTIIHTHSLKTCKSFDRQSVLIVGLGNSAADVAVDCTFVAEQVYMSTRRGSWVMGRTAQDGKPYDLDLLRRRNEFFLKFLPFNLQCKFWENRLTFDHAIYNLKPEHRILNAHPTMNDTLPSCILNGRVIVKGDIERFEEDGVVFAGESKVTKVDSVILATGYEIKFPFLDSSVISVKNNRVHLYKYILPPNLKHPTLACIGVIQALGAFFPIAEMQCRWFMQILAGKLKLPCKEEMVKDIDKKNLANKKRFLDTIRHTIEADWLPYLDDLSEMFGAKPNLLKLAITDPKLFWTCFNGPCLPYQFRLQGPHPWPEARKAILTSEERVYAPLNSHGNKQCEKKNGFISGKFRFFILMLCTMCVMYGLKYQDLSYLTLLSEIEK